MVRSPHFPVAQVIKRISKLEHMTSDGCSDMSYPKVKTFHKDGSIPPHVTCPVSEYKEIYLAKFCIKVVTGDNCIKSKDSIGLVRNIILIIIVLYIMSSLLSQTFLTTQLNHHSWESSFCQICL